MSTKGNSPQKRTMADIARRAGVSTSTVSRALTRPDQVNAKTLAAIQKIASELGFRPNLVGRQLRAGTANSLLVLVQDLANPFHSEIFKGAEIAALAHNYTIMVGDTDYSKDAERLYTDLFLGGRVDGLILMVGGHLPAGLSSEMALNSPVVLLNEENPDLDLPSVLVDNTRWAETAVGYLIGHGHSRIAHIAGPLSRTISRDRLEGYRRALAGAGLPNDPELEIEADFSLDQGRAAAAGLLALPNRPTAIFCVSDHSAVGAIMAARDAGLSVPEDLSVIGFDDGMLAEIVTPPLTTVRQPRREMGAAAAELAIGMIDNRPPLNRHMILNCSLIERGSVSAWRGN